MSMGEDLGPIPDVAEPIIAWRQWTTSGFRLVGFRGEVWRPGVDVHAECKRQKVSGDYLRLTADPCPGAPSADIEGHDGHGCGIYGYRDAATLAGKADLLRTRDTGLWFTTSETPYIAGTVFLWGRVFEHEAGWRAEHAALRSLCPVGTMDPEVVADAARLYGVPVEPFPMDDDAIREAYQSDLARSFMATFTAQATGAISAFASANASLTFTLNTAPLLKAAPPTRYLPPAPAAAPLRSVLDEADSFWVPKRPGDTIRAMGGVAEPEKAKATEKRRRFLYGRGYF